MLLAVPPEKLRTGAAILERYEVASSFLGRFTDDRAPGGEYGGARRLWTWKWLSFGKRCPIDPSRDGAAGLAPCSGSDPRAATREDWARPFAAF